MLETNTFLIMLVFLQILSVLSCDLIDLPTSLEYFSPSYEQTHKIEASGQFYSPHSPIKWEFDVFEDSWFRITLEPKYFSLHITLSLTPQQATKTIQSSSFGQISTKLPAGSYSFQMDPDAFEEIDDENLGCSKANIYLNLALIPINSIYKTNTDNIFLFGFPDMPNLTDTLKYSGYFIDNDQIGLKTEDLSGLLHVYNFTLDIPSNEQKQSGITGTWKVNFALSNT